MIATNNRDIIHPRERFVALPLWKDSNLRDLTAQTGNVQKTSFPIGCPYKWYSQPLDSIDVVLTRLALTVSAITGLQQFVQA